MKKTLITGLMALLFSMRPGFAAELNLLCITEYPTTTFAIGTRGEFVYVRVIHHNGTKYMPIRGYASTEVTPFDLPKLNDSAMRLTPLGTDQVYRFPIANCEAKDWKTFQCTVGENEKIDGIDVRPWLLYSSTITEESLSYRGQKLQVNLGLDLLGANDTISMSYSEGECLPTASDIFSSSLLKR